MAAGGNAPKEVNDFTHLGSWDHSSNQELPVREGGVLKASLWNANLPRNIKLSFFYATVESGLLYASKAGP